MFNHVAWARCRWQRFMSAIRRIVASIETGEGSPEPGNQSRRWPQHETGWFRNWFTGSLTMATTGWRRGTSAHPVEGVAIVTSRQRVMRTVVPTGAQVYSLAALSIAIPTHPWLPVSQVPSGFW